MGPKKTDSRAVSFHPKIVLTARQQWLVSMPSQEARMCVFFNNCHNYNHAALFGVPDAFFDVDFNRYSKIVGGLPPGTECVVLGHPGNDLVFDYYTLAGQQCMINPHTQGQALVFFGQHLGQAAFPGAGPVAGRGPAYNTHPEFFNRIHHIRQTPVPCVRLCDPATRNGPC
jgi:hypothetical protein